MKCIAFGDKESLRTLEKSIAEFTRRTGREVAFASCTDIDAFYKSVPKRWDVAVVWHGGASGMEVANHVRDLNRTIPLIWVSDDTAFAIHSYRLHTKAFLSQPVSEEEIAHALLRCVE